MRPEKWAETDCGDPEGAMYYFQCDLNHLKS